MKKAHLFGCTAFAALNISLLSSAALGQTAPNITDQDTFATPAGGNQEIIVTGSRIRHSPLEQASPVTFVDQADIARTGLSSISDVLQRLPSAGGGLNSKTNNSGNFGNPPDGGGVGAGASEIDLRYLGSRRTLVLVDSLRFVNGASASGVPGSVDLNAIPQAAIERVEVLQDGASAIYGSDAVAGVVNIITKTKQDGFIGSAQHGIYNRGDGFTQNYDLSYGFGNKHSGTDIVVGASYVKQGPIFAGDRSGSRFPTPFTNACDSSCSSYTPLGRFIVFDQDLTLKAPVAGRPTYTPANPTGPGSDFKDFTNADRFNFAPYNYILTPYERIGAFANVTQELGPDIKFSGKFFYNHRTSKNQAAPLPLGVGQDAGNGNLLDTVTIDATNPYNPFGVTLDNSNYSAIFRRLVEGGPRRYDQAVDTYYGTGTVSGQFQLGAGTWYWDVNGVYGKNNARQTVHGNVNAANVQQALGPVADCTGACVPLNIFGGVGSITPDMYNFIAFTQRDRSSQRLWDASVNLTGHLLTLPAGPLGVAVGYEHRDLQGSFTPDPVVAAGLGSDIPALPTRGSYNVNEVYGELSIPILKDMPFFKLLNGSFAVRHSDYSTSGSETTIKGGVDWMPTADFRLRGTYAQGFRAPTIGELFGTPSRFDQEIDDPCSLDNASGPNFSNSATIRANCIAHGVPAAGYTQNGLQKSVITGGNAALKAETSRSWVGGGVYSASWASGFAKSMTLEANYFNIHVDNAIQAIDAGTQLSRCVEENDAFSCAAITRSATGQITRIEGLLGNIAGIKTDGVDVNFNYRSPTTPYGSFGLYWANTFLLHYTEIVPATTGTTSIPRQGTERGSPDQAFPRYKFTAILDWSLGDFAASLTGRYISQVRETEFNDHPLGRRLYGDLQLMWNGKVSDRAFNFAVGVNNLAGTAPPACFSCGLNNYDPTTYDVPGQFFYARIGVKM